MNTPELSDYDYFILDSNARSLRKYADALSEPPHTPVVVEALKAVIAMVCRSVRQYFDDPHEVADRACTLAYLSYDLPDGEFAESARALAAAIDTFLAPAKEAHE